MTVADLRKDYVFILEDDPEAIFKLTPQEILHAISPDLAARSKNMPKGASQADFWMLKHGDPLTAVNAALALAGLAGDMFQFTCVVSVKPKMSAEVAIIYQTPDGATKTAAEATTLPAAITAAALKFAIQKGVTV